MSTYYFFALLPLEADDQVNLNILKSRYNRLAIHSNVHWPILSEEEKEKVHSGLFELAEQLKKYHLD